MRVFIPHFPNLCGLTIWDKENKQSSFPSLASPFFLSFLCRFVLVSSFAVEYAFFFFFFLLANFAEISVFLGLRFFWGFFGAFCCFGVVDLLGFVWLAALWRVSFVSCLLVSWWCGVASEFWTVGSPQIPAVWIIKELGSLIGVCMEVKNYFAQLHEQYLIKSTKLEFKISIQEMFDFGYDSFRLYSGAWLFSSENY
jgi:hypothetical protein